ncbi:hypothetical protein H4R18_002296, partial [Coemansia javaensis]
HILSGLFGVERARAMRKRHIIQVVYSMSQLSKDMRAITTNRINKALAGLQGSGYVMA